MLDRALQFSILNYQQNKSAKYDRNTRFLLKTFEVIYNWAIMQLKSKCGMFVTTKYRSPEKFLQKSFIHLKIQIHAISRPNLEKHA